MVKKHEEVVANLQSHTYKTLFKNRHSKMMVDDRLLQKPTKGNQLNLLQCTLIFLQF